MKHSPTKLEHFTKLITSFYEPTHVCNNVGDEQEAPEPNLLTEEEENELYTQIYEGEVTPEKLPVNLYVESGEYLSGGIEKGLTEADKLGVGIPPSQTIFNSLRENAYIFSGARTFQQVLRASEELIDPVTGKIRTFSDFKKQASGIFEDFNKNWIKTEYIQALNGAQMVSKWEDIVREADLFPLLKYDTVGDLRVREEHEALDGIIKPVSDPFWLKYYPKNGWRCRCDVQKLSEIHEDKITDLSRVNIPDIAPEFEFNVGVTRTLYPENHPFFVVPKKYQSEAKKNFGLPDPEPRKLKGLKETPKKVEEKKVEIEGLTGKWTRGNLKGVQAENHKNAEEFIGQQLPDELFKRLKFPINLKDSKSSQYEYFTKTLNFSKSKNKKFVQQVFIHELGHANHFMSGEVQLLKTSERFKKLVEGMKQEAKKRYLNKAKESKSFSVQRVKKDREFAYLDSILKPIRSDIYSGRSFGEGMVEDFKIVGLLDTIGGITNGRFGEGHQKSYYSNGNGNAEVFAHFTENYFLGNPYFEKYFPDTYKKSKKYIESILNERLE